MIILKRDKFDVLTPSPPGGKGGNGTSADGVQNYPPTSGEPSSGKDRKPGKKYAPEEGKGSGKGKEEEPENGSGSGSEGKEKKERKGSSGDDKTSYTGASKKIEKNGIGGVLGEDDSREIQKELGVPVELPDDNFDEEMVSTATEHSHHLTSGTQGSGKGTLRRMIAELSRPKVDWRKALKRYIGKALGGMEEYMGARRHLHSGNYFVGDRNKYDSIMSSVMAVDTSGSMSKEAIVAILTEAYGIITQKKIKNTQIVYFDDGLQGHDRVKNPPHFDFSQAKGGGGTSFSEPLEFMEEQWKKGKLNVGIFFTDGYANLNLKKPGFAKVFVWVILGNPEFKPPFGDMVVYINKETDV